MITGLSLIIVLGTIVYYFFQKLNLPGLLGLLFLGMLIGPYGLNLLDKNLLLVSEDIRKIALVIILLRAGLGLGKEELKAIGPAALRLSILPGVLEGGAIIAFAFYFLNFSFAEAGALAFIIAAVSPAVIVPHMLKLKDESYGEDKRVPTLILAGASVDDIVAITFFTSFVSLYFGNSQNILWQGFSILLSIILGICLGLCFGFLLLRLIKIFAFDKVRTLLFVLGFAMALLFIEKFLQPYIAISGFLGVMAIGYFLLERDAVRAKQLAEGFNKIWVLAELCLFVLIGATVDVSLAIDSGMIGVAMIVIGLVARSIGVWLSLIGTNLNDKEKLFTNISYLPKATVQASIGAIPLSLGMEHGAYILALAVMSIVLTAPVGAYFMDLTYPKLLVKGKRCEK